MKKLIKTGLMTGVLCVALISAVRAQFISYTDGLGNTISAVAYNDGYDVGNVAGPIGGLTLDGTTLYGMTENGGDFQEGSVFSVTPSGTITSLVSFDGFRGSNPSGGLILDGNTLYGTTSGGTSGRSTVFSVTPSVTPRGTVSTVAVLNDTSGYSPSGRLIQKGNTFYGTATEGGQFGSGSVFSVTPSGTLNTIASFSGITPEGADPENDLLLYHGVIYGTTAYGGAYGAGSVFALTQSVHYPRYLPSITAMDIFRWGA